MRLLMTLCAAFLLQLPLYADMTLAIIKPNAAEANHIGEMLARYEQAGLRISGIKMVRLTPTEAKEFYAEHNGKPFFNDLVNFMTSGPAVVIALEGDNAVQRNRELMGSLDKKGTLRGDFGDSTTKNAVHGSDSAESAKREIGFFFAGRELQSRAEVPKAPNGTNGQNARPSSTVVPVGR